MHQMKLFCKRQIPFDIELGKTKDSFIFSFKTNIKDVIISNVEDADRAIVYRNRRGPQFGRDIIIQVRNDETAEDYNVIRYKKSFYEKKIRNTEGDFSIEDYEVFQIIER